MDAAEHCKLFCAWKGGGPCLADDCPRREEKGRLRAEVEALRALLRSIRNTIDHVDSLGGWDSAFIATSSSDIIDSIDAVLERQP